MRRGGRGFFSVRNRCTARIPPQIPVTSHYHHDGRAACFGFVQSSVVANLALTFPVEVTFRTRSEVGDSQKHCNDARITAQSRKSFNLIRV